MHPAASVISQNPLRVRARLFANVILSSHQSDILRAAFDQQLTAFCLFSCHFAARLTLRTLIATVFIYTHRQRFGPAWLTIFLIDVSVRNAQSVRRSPRNSCCTQCASNRCECFGRTRIDTRALHVRMNLARMFLYAVRRVTRARDAKNFAQRRAQGLDDFESETKY